MNFNIASGKQSCQICTQQESVRACYIDVVFSLRVQAIDCQLKLFYFLKVETMDSKFHKKEQFPANIWLKKHILPSRGMFFL